MWRRPTSALPVGKQGMTRTDNGVGVLLTNVGSPAAPTSAALRRYLAEFLSDRRIIDWPRWLWLPVLHGIILNTRPRRSARLYAHIWTADGSPQLITLRQQAEGVRALLQALMLEPVPVVGALRYGEPSIAAGLRALRTVGARRILVVPLFPQYSATTTASALDAVFDELRRWPEIPELRTVRQYHQHPAYAAALAASVRRAWADRGQPDRLLISFHGIPERYARAGDPYPQACAATAEGLAAALDLRANDWQLAYQSRFGPEPWLRPYTDQTLTAWGASGLKRVDVICPGFSADCLETLDEIGHEGERVFKAAGGGELRYLPALNAEPDHLDALADIAAEGLAGWLPRTKHTGRTRAQAPAAAHPVAGA